MSLALFLAAFGPLSTRYGFPSGNSSTAPIDATATVTPVSCENALFPPPHRAGLWTSGLWILSTPNAEEAQSPFSLGFVDAQCGHVSLSGAFLPGAFLPHHAMSDCRCRLGDMPRWPSRPASYAGLESSTASSVRLMHGAGSTLEAAARPSGSKDPYLAACRRVLLETIGVGLYFAMRRGRCRAHGMRLLFILLVWFVIQCARVTWLLSCLSFAVPLASLLGLWAIACYVTQILRFVGLAVVDSISLALIRPLIACVDLVAATVTATTRRSVGTLSCLTSALDRRANWVATLSEPALAVLVNALHRGYVGKKRRWDCDVQLRVRRALQAVTTTTWLERLLQTHRCVMVVLDDGDPSEPYVRRVTAVYTHVVSTVAAAIFARAIRLASWVIRRTQGAMLTTGLTIAGELRRIRDYLIKTACFLSGRLTPAWHVRQMLVAAYGRLCISKMGTMMRLRPFWVLALLPLVRTAGDESKRVPSFSGERVDFTAWFMLFSAYVAYKLVSAAPLVAGRRPKPPAAPAAIKGRLAPEPPAPPAPTKASDGTVSNQVEIDAANAARLAWMNTPTVVLNEAEIKAATEALEKWTNDNTQLYGLVVQAMPSWLVTSLYNSHLNDGIAAIEYLRTAFDANSGDGGDHAAHLSRLQSRTIDARSDISVTSARVTCAANLT